MVKIIKRKIIPILLLLFLLSLVSSVSPKTVQGQTYQGFVDQLDNGLNKETLDWYTWTDAINSGLKTMIGDQEQATGTSMIKTDSGALGFASGMVGSIYSSPPASGIYYAYDLLHRFGAAPVYAQGVGFTRLRPILRIWKVFRDLTYIFFTLIFIFVGIAIMFRVKISPQAVITIENALPKIIGALILVTFSYAIAGFMIDLMYVLMALGITILQSGGVDPAMISTLLGKTLRPTPQNVIRSGFFGLIPMFFSTKSMGFTIFGSLIGGMIGALAGGGLGLLGGPLGSVVGAAAGAGAGLLAGPSLVALVWAVIALFLLLKLLFNLLKAYIRIILSIIFAPLHIMTGAIPGVQAMGFGKWLKGMLADLLAFPAVMMIAMIGVYLSQTFDVIKNADAYLWTPPLLGLPLSLPNAHGLLMRTLIGMGILLFLPSVPDMIRNAMGIKDSGIGGIIGGAIGAPIGAITYLPRQIGAMVGEGVQKAGVGVVSDIAREPMTSFVGRVKGRILKGKSEGEGRGGSQKGGNKPALSAQNSPNAGKRWPR